MIYYSFLGKNYRVNIIFKTIGPNKFIGLDTVKKYRIKYFMYKNK